MGSDSCFILLFLSDFRDEVSHDHFEVMARGENRSSAPHRSPWIPMDPHEFYFDPRGHGRNLRLLKSSSQAS